MSEQLAAISRWIDEHPANAQRDPEALTWHRVMKVAEEAGEVTAAMIGSVGGNPRKGETHDGADVIEELLDVAVSALSGVEHMTANGGLSLGMLLNKIDRVAARAGIAA